jgi:WD40 repeat protein
MSGGVDGAILLWQFSVAQPISTYRPSGRPKVTKIRFSWNGSKFAAGDAAGNILLWRFDSQVESVIPYLVCIIFSSLFGAYLLAEIIKFECDITFRSGKHIIRKCLILPF